MKKVLFSLYLGPFLFPAIIFAATYEVNSLGDTGVGTFRQAIIDSNSNPGTDTINVTVSGTVTLASDLPNFSENQNVVINGNDLTIDGNNLYTALKIGSNINDDVIEATINSLTITRCNVTTSSDKEGAGLYVYPRAAIVTINDSTFSDNEAEEGGAIWHRGTLTINRSSFNNNSAVIGRGNGGDGGAILRNGSEGNLLITESSFSNNGADDQGGAILVENGASADISMSIFTSNEAPNDDGGAIHISDGSVQIDKSTLDNNTSGDNGGAINVNDGTLTMENSTVSGNFAARGGGIRNRDSATLANVTVANNSANSGGGGVDTDSGGTTTLTNSIIGDTSSGGDCVSNGSVSATYTLIEDSGSDACDLTGVSGNIIGSDPALGVLSDNGCVTPAGAPAAAACVRTHALLSGSPAINAASNAECPSDDERGFVRADNQCDMGAFERDEFPPPPPVPVPALSQWGMLLMSMLLALVGFLGLRRRFD
jgi:predicted outer membrane repeat protein